MKIIIEGDPKEIAAFKAQLERDKCHNLELNKEKTQERVKNWLLEGFNKMNLNPPSHDKPEGDL